VQTARDWNIGTGVSGYAWDAARPRAVLLLQHGFAEYAQRYVEFYSELIPHVLDLGVSVSAFDLNGHGHSPGLRGMTDVDASVAHHLAARRLLVAQPLPVFLMGHSLGGTITATSVARDPTQIAGVILSSPALLVTVDPVLRACVRVAAVVAPALPVRRFPIERISRIPEQVQAAKDDPLMYHGAMCARLAASILFTSDGNWKQYSEWDVPTLVMHGTADVFTETEGSRKFFATIPSTDKALHIVEGGYHELLNDLDAGATLRVVLNWLERRLPRANP
jgi:acylglycerol lipase